MYVSENLDEWNEVQRIVIDGMWECPDIFTLQDQFGKSYQIFWSADGYYVVGHLCKNHFIKTGNIKSAYQCNTSESVRYYAAQTFSNMGKRVLQLAWIQSEHHEGFCYTGEMSLPVEISLHTEEEEQRLCFHPTNEIEKLRREYVSFDLKNMLVLGSQKSHLYYLSILTRWE